MKTEGSASIGTWVRVYNYGEHAAGDDSLGLDQRRVNIPTRRLSNNIVIGAIDISLASSGDPSRGLIEKTNREGFVENEAYANFKAIVLGALIEFEHLREDDKNRIRSALKSVPEIRKRVSRAKVLEFFAELPPCLVGIEACPSAHHWGRELQALGHMVRLTPPSYVKAYLKRSKNDANDAAAICEAVTRPSMRFVPVKTKEQQTALMLHRTRQLLVRQRTMLSYALRGHLAELGIVSAKGRNGTGELLRIIADGADTRVPATVRGILDVLARQYSAIGAEIGSIDKSILALHRSCEASRRLAEIPGIGPVGATAMVAEIGDWKTFSSGRSLAAWIGLMPKQHTTGGKDGLGSITKQGNRYLRWLLVVGAMAVIRYAR